MPSLLTKSPWIPLLASVLLAGCVGSIEIAEYNHDMVEFSEADSVSPSASLDRNQARAEADNRRTFDEGSEEPEAEGFILAPEVVTGYVGEVLLVEVVPVLRQEETVGQDRHAEGL